VVKGGYLAGDSFTFADINVMPILFYLQKFPEAATAIAAAKPLAAYSSGWQHGRAFRTPRRRRGLCPVPHIRIDNNPAEAYGPGTVKRTACPRAAQ
jgi:hypothetical protein